MSYFNHAYQKCFVATGTPTGDQSGAGVADVSAGIVVQTGVHVSELKNQLAPFALGPGVVGLFDAKTNLSTDAAGIVASCCTFYIAAAALKLSDKQGPFHGGYQESNKSKDINPKFIRKIWSANGNAPTQAILCIGGLADNNTTYDTLVAGTTYAAPGTSGITTSGGTGTGMIVSYQGDGNLVTDVTIESNGDGLYAIGDVITIVDGDSAATFTITGVDLCNKEFICGESYNLRVEIKGTPALRFAAHNLNRTFEAGEPCCVDPDDPLPTDSMDVYKQWATQISEDTYLSPFVLAVLVVDGQSYAYDAAAATALGLDPLTELYSDAPITVLEAGIILVGAYVDTQFENCTFQTTDYYGLEPIQLFSSEVDLNGDPCTFEGLCVNVCCLGVQGNGLGESKVRDLILSESYLQNFMANDLRIREITQGNEAYNVLSRTAIYSSYYILHSVPRYNNPSGVFDNDQYLLEIVGDDATVTLLTTLFDTVVTDCGNACDLTDDYTVAGCTNVIPNP